jgi:hypothetical protein
MSETRKKIVEWKDEFIKNNKSFKNHTYVHSSNHRN